MLTINTDTLRAEVGKHLAADALVKGIYWEYGKGCFIGCLAHSSDAAKLGDLYGLPLPLVKICENIFEYLPEDQGKAFFRALPEAVGCDGKDLTRVHWAFLASELRALPEVPVNIQAVIDPVIAGMDLLAAGKKWDRAAADAAADAAAYAAARAAARAAYAAAYNAYAAADAADAAAYNAARDADAAAYAAARAADVAAEAVDAAADVAYAAADVAYAADAARIRQRDTILALIAAA